jgi:hypothetical protein
MKINTNVYQIFTTELLFSCKCYMELIPYMHCTKLRIHYCEALFLHLPVIFMVLTGWIWIKLGMEGCNRTCWLYFILLK